jgi:nicotinate-nucleotide pyrophosphorylase (carboxylating)
MLEAVALPLVKWALSEDVGSGDITTLNTLPAGIGARAVIVMKEPCVVAGLEVARLTFREVDSHLTFEPLAADGDRVDAGVAVARVFGSAGGILTGERTALNFLQRLTSVATQTRRFVDAVAGTHAIILDTRKTTPGLRYLEKYAVKLGGGENHRFALWDMYLVKDNHIRAAGGVTAAIERIQRTRQDVPLEVDRILVDNRPVEEVERAVEEVDQWFAKHPPESRRMKKGARRWPEIEVSGGLSLENVRRYAETGVDYLSVGALTHSAPAVNLSLEIEDVG